MINNVSANDSYDYNDRIKEHLKLVLPEKVYLNWIEDMTFSFIDGKKIVARYFGTGSLKEFNREYKDLVFVSICTVTGYVKKFQVIKSKIKADAPVKETKSVSKADTGNKRIKMNIKAVRLFALGMIFTFIAVLLSVVAVNFVINRNFNEEFYSVGSIKVNNRIRVIQISDLHDSSYGKENSELISRIKKLEPDLIIMTGDCIELSDESESKTVELCKKLAQIAPSYYIYGNNEVERLYDIILTKDNIDEKYGFDDDNREPSRLTEKKDEFQTRLEDVGVKVLKNEFDTITVGSTNVDVYGVLTSNPSAFWPYAGESYGRYLYENTNNYKITAIHEPHIFETFTDEESWGDLILCGHTHGGVARLPIIGPIYAPEIGFLPARKDAYVYGRYANSGTLIVSSGLTNNNIYRINNQPELVIVDVDKF